MILKLLIIILLRFYMPVISALETGMADTEIAIETGTENILLYR